MSKKVKVTAPRTLGKAIQIALNDLALVERDKNFSVDMETCWLESRKRYDWETTQTCEVCFAGTVMAKTHAYQERALKRDGFSISPNDFPTAWRKVFNAIDSIRKYNIVEALYDFYDEETAAKKFTTLLQSMPVVVERPDRAWNDDEENNLVELDLDIRKFFGNVHTYNSKPAAFKNNMRKLARLFIKLGV